MSHSYPHDDTPCLDTSLHDHEMDVGDDDCAHEWVTSEETDRCYCIYCGEDGDA